jgi:hypothetical protein
MKKKKVVNDRKFQIIFTHSTKQKFTFIFQFFLNRLNINDSKIKFSKKKKNNGNDITIFKTKNK